MEEEGFHEILAFNRTKTAWIIDGGDKRIVGELDISTDIV